MPSRLGLAVVSDLIIALCCLGYVLLGAEYAHSLSRRR